MIYSLSWIEREKNLGDDTKEAVAQRLKDEVASCLYALISIYPYMASFYKCKNKLDKVHVLYNFTLYCNVILYCNAM